jgi:hypothetical protein
MALAFTVGGWRALLFALLGKDPVRGLSVFLVRALERRPGRCPNSD